MHNKKNSSWEQFLKTGKVKDYLTYREEKNKVEFAKEVDTYDGKTKESRSGSKNKDYKENACLVTLLTKEGIINLIVRGAKKANSKTRILTNQYSVIDFCQTDTNSLNTLTEGVVVDSNLPLYKDVLKLNYAQVIVEKILVLANSLSSFDILYDFFLQTIKLLGETSYPEIVVLLFEVKLWYLLGIAPNFQSCPRCGKKYKRIFYDFSRRNYLF